MIKAIIFDMDGVLVKVNVWPIHNQILERYGINVSKEQIPKYLGRPLVTQIDLLEKDYNIDIDKKKYLEEFSDLQKEEIDNLQKSEMLIELMEKINSLGFKIGVATSSTRERAVKILEKLGIINYLGDLVTRENYENAKPNPEIFLKAAKNLEVDPSECIVIEDAINGIEAAKAGGIKTIGLSGKYHAKSDFKDANMAIDSLNEINLEQVKNL